MMNRFDNMLGEMCSIDREAAKGGWLNEMHPLVKLFVTIWFVCFVISFQNNMLMGILSMSVYLVICFLMADISLYKCLKRMRTVLFAFFIFGGANILFSGDLRLGMIAAAGFWCKGVMSVFAVYVLIVTTAIDDICGALRIMHVPELLVTVIMLIYRYINILIKETKRLSESYFVLSPGQKGIHAKAWGQFAGNLMLRSIDRAKRVYDSMNMAGYEWRILSGNHKKYRLGAGSLIWLFVWMGIIAAFRIFPVFELVGALLVG
ncbi:MAG: energy-coupling factor transporter transmembrane protein EcfT [Clostridium sp.]|nr:energy-coupling factor transporter transmembrane protein EcfT [Clostridium sp.]